MSAVKVAVRVRPFTEREISRDAKCVISMKDRQTSLLASRAAGEPKRFTFDYSVRDKRRQTAHVICHWILTCVICLHSTGHSMLQMHITYLRRRYVDVIVIVVHCTVARHLSHAHTGSRSPIVYPLFIGRCSPPV